MKNTKRILSILFVTAVLVVGFAFSASAKTEQSELEYVESNTNIAVQIVYDTGTKPDITIVSPSGTLYNEQNADFDHYPDGKTIVFYIPDARSGQWYIRYDSAYTGHLAVNVIEYSRNISIESFTLNEVSGTTAKVSFVTEFPKSISYNYEISAVTLDQNGNVEGKRLLGSGSATSGNLINKSVSLSSLASWGDYYLMLDVYYEDYDTEVSHSAISQKFSYNNTTSPAPITGYKVYFNNSTGEMSIDWSGVYIYNASNYNVAVEADGVLVYTYQHTGSERKAELTVAADAKEYKVSLSYVKSGKYSQISTVTFKPDTAALAINTPELTSSAQAEIVYNLVEKQDAVVYVNGDSGEKVMLEGSGSFSVPLKEGYNTVSVNRQISDNVIIVSQKSIYSDRFAPVLSFFESLDRITTDESSFTVVGATEAGSSFTVNGAEKAVDADGSFAVDLTLKKGVNTFEFVVADAAGNRTVRSINIVCIGEGAEEEGAFDWVLVIIIAAIALLVIALGATVIVLVKKKKLNLTSILVLVTVLCAIGTIVLAVMAIGRNNESDELNKVINSEEFFEIAEESVDKAYEAITKAETAKKEAKSFTTYVWVAAIATVISIAGIFVSHKYFDDGKELLKRAKEKSSPDASAKDGGSES